MDTEDGGEVEKVPIWKQESGYDIFLRRWNTHRHAHIKVTYSYLNANAQMRVETVEGILSGGRFGRPQKHSRLPANYITVSDPQSSIDDDKHVPADTISSLVTIRDT